MISHFLMFNGNCAEALDVYANALGAQIVERQTYGDMPPDPSSPVTDEIKDLVMYAALAIGDETIMCADASEHLKLSDNMYVSIMTPDGALIRKAWDILKEGGEVYMDLQPTFFAEVHGSLQDKFGVNWMFTMEK